MAKELRCPGCQRLAMQESLAYSATLGMFVCPACRASSPAPLPEAAPPPSQQPVPMPPPPSFLDTPLPTPAAEPPPAPQPLTAPIAPEQTPHRGARTSPLLWALGLVFLAAIVTTIAVVLTRPGAPPVDPQRAWDQAHHAEIIALKSQAEALAIEGKLKEAHARYREIETIIGGRQVKEPTLFDMVEVARQDQDKIYKLLLSQMERSRPQPAPARLASPAPAASYTPPTPSAAPPKPLTADSLDLTPDAAPPPATRLPTSAPATVVSSEPTTLPAGAVQFLQIPRGPVSDEQIGQAIQRGVDYLLANMAGGQIKEEIEVRERYREGLTALCVYALASSGKAIVDQRLNSKSPEMIQMLEKLKSYTLEREGEVHAPLVYARSLRACALATFNRPQDREALEDDVDWLINASMNGAYTYDDRFAQPRKPRQRRRPTTVPRAALSDGPAYVPELRDDAGAGADVILTDGVFTPRPPAAPGRPAVPTLPPKKVFENTLPPRRITQPDDRYRSQFPWDNSNSQYGLLGVWAGAEVGCEVPDNYWRMVQRHWTSCQLPSGEWNYNGNDDPGRYSMTVAGVASLLVTHDHLEAPLLGGRLAGRQPYSVPLSAGLSWLEDHDNSINILGEPLFYVGYNLFGLERVGLASGFKHFGAHDWFVELCAKVLPTQWPNGAFGLDDADRKSVIETAYALLFLSRGRHPLMFNKLRYDGNWTNRPREIANLTNYTAKQLERPLNWQVVDITREPHEWADAPVLYMSGHLNVKLSEDDLRKLAEFVDNGGILFTHADLGGEQFNRFAMELSKQLFPKHGPLKDLPNDHAIYKVNFPIAQPRPRLQGVSNGVRLVMLHCPVDLSNAWQVRATVSRKEAFHLGTNIYLYATGKERFRNRLDTPIVPLPDQAPLREVPLARLMHDGNWDPEPGAWPRMGRKMHWETGVMLEPKNIPLAELSPENFRLAHLTGTDALSPTEAEIAAMKRFVESGGTLLIDAAGGSSQFADAEAAWLPQILGDAELEIIKEDDPLLKHTIDGTVDMPDKTLRLYAMEQLANDTSPRLKIARVGADGGAGAGAGGGAGAGAGRVIFSPLDIATGLLGTNTWGIVGYLPEYSEALVRNIVLTSAPEMVDR